MSKAASISRDETRVRLVDAAGRLVTPHRDLAIQSRRGWVSPRMLAVTNPSTRIIEADRGGVRPKPGGRKDPTFCFAGFFPFWP